MTSEPSAADVAGMLRALQCPAEREAAALMLADLFAERDDAEAAAECRRLPRFTTRFTSVLVEVRAVRLGLTTWELAPRQQEAVRFQERVDALGPATLPPAPSTPLTLRDLAHRAQALLNALGLRGVSVTAPPGALGGPVGVVTPHRLDGLPQRDPDGPPCPVRHANREAAVKTLAILLAAFPDITEAMWRVV